jgi:hypothetical protein
VTARRFHLVMRAVWVGLIVPTLLWWRDSILWVAFMSIYACIGYHSERAGQCKVEEKVDES